MIGAWKIDENTDDLQRLKELFDLGLNNSEISRIYRTNNGHSLTRPYIKAIRAGRRWNPDERSFLMKSEIEYQSPTNYCTLRIWDKDKMVNVVELTPQQIFNMKEQISNIFTNETSGLTIIIDVKS